MKRQRLDLKRTTLRVGIVLPPRCWAGSVHLARELLLMAGTLRPAPASEAPLFEVLGVGATRRAVVSFGGATLRPDATPRDAGALDLVVLPAQFAPTAEPSTEELALADFVRDRHAAGALVLSLGGALLLARTGLLDGQEATGLVSERALMARCAPRVRYVPSRRLVVRGSIVTAAGIGPTAEAVAVVLERLAGAALAHRFLRFTSTGALPAREQLSLFSAQWTQHGDERIAAAQEIVERELHRPPSLAALAARTGLSERALSRRFVEATGLTLRAYVAALRVALAESLVRSTELPLVHVADECGFSSASALVRAFTARFGHGPGRHRMISRGG